LGTEFVETLGRQPHLEALAAEYGAQYSPDVRLVVDDEDLCCAWSNGNVEHRITSV
jgi:hypothetical protein